MAYAFAPSLVASKAFPDGGAGTLIWINRAWSVRHAA
jgi:hypothetical protein